MKVKNVINKRKEYLQLFDKETSLFVYLDLSNMFHWQDVLGWRFRFEDIILQLQRMKSVKEIKVYYGLNERDSMASRGFHKRIRKTGAILRTKPVKYIRKSVNEGFFIRRKTMSLFNDDISKKVFQLVDEMKKVCEFIEEPKCNFDVEMTMDLLDDMDKLSAVAIFSGDSDLAAPLERLKLKGKKVYIIGVRGMTAKELHAVKDRYIDFGKLYDGQKRYF